VWIEALLEKFKGNNEYKLVVVTTSKVKNVVKTEKDGVVYYVLPDTFPILYNENKISNINVWQEFLEEEKPDLIQLWGTEFTHGLCALRLAKNIPSVIYMQGYIGSIARHYLAGMTYNELKKNVTFRDIVKKDSILRQQKKYISHTEKEKEMFNLSGRIISENEWCSMSIKAVCPKIEVYNCPLSVNYVFSKYNWDIERSEKHSVICNASGYPLKGLHMILKAIALLKSKYPDIKLYIPGAKVISNGSAEGFLRKRGYAKYIEKLIKKLDIEDNVVWLESLSQEELARYYQKVRVFVLCSSIENHSSSLKEAMMVGTPCVASAVGGIPEYVRHGENGFLYRFEEYEIMAGYIEKLFENDALAKRLSKTGNEDILRLHTDNGDTEIMIDIYKHILGE
jgi:glycosyltransferase involved in cell wall biosynthesis